MKKLDLRVEFEEQYQGSDLQKIVNNNPVPSKYTIDGVDCYFHNPDLFGLMELKIKKDGLTPDDFAIDYKNGFEAGLLHLKNKEEITVKDLKSKDLREGTISQLKHLLHEREFKYNTKGLLHLVFKTTPGIFTKKTIYDYGYWNAVIYSIDELWETAGLNTDDLQKFPSQPLENQKLGQLTNKQKALIAVYTKQTITRKDGNAIYNEFTHFSSRQNRIGSEQTDLKIKNKIK